MARRTIRKRLAAGALPAAVAAAVAVGIGAAVGAAAKPAVSMRGSPASMERQYERARAADLTFAETADGVDHLVERKRLVRLEGSTDYALHQVSYPYARPEVKTFVERLAAQYRRACGERLVVTSLTRPRKEQPGNAHRLSVHPTGMAVDFRISRSAKCRDWIEKAFLGLERGDLLDATRERNPPHYHVAVFTDAYRAWAARRPPPPRAAETPAAAPARPAPAAEPSSTAPVPPAAAERPAAPAQREEADAPLVLGLLSSLAALFWLGVRIARHHGPG